MIRIAIVLAALSPLAVLAQSSQTVSVPGLSAPVEIYTPASGIPSIVAKNEQDAAFMQGWLHARDRFWQMDYFRRIASGTLAELLGPAALANDIQFRTIGFRRDAWQSYAAYSEKGRANLQAYSNGVNFWLSTNPLPPEYAALELTEAEPWSPVDSLAFGKLLSFNLSADLEELDLTIALGTYQGVGNAVGFDGVALFFEDTFRQAPPDDRVTLPDFLSSIGVLGMKSEGRDRPKSIPMYTDERIDLARNLVSKYRSNPVMAKILDKDLEDKGSNIWMISGDLTDTGAPIIANDPHLALDMPATWYPQHVNVTDDQGAELFNVSGVAFAGAPIIALGCNSTLCWGATVNPIDEGDFFFESLRFNTLGLPTHTVYQGQEERILWVYQSFYANQFDGVPNNLERQNVSIAGGGITFLVPRRNNGPILDLDLSTGTGISFQYTGQGPTFELEAFAAMGEAQDVEEFGEAVQQFDFGSQNLGVADIFGNIGYFTPAEVPIRSDLQLLNAPDGGVPPLLIRDGTGGLMHEWLPVANPQPSQATNAEILPINEQPSAVNPPSGFIANANNDPVGTTLDNNTLNQVRPGGGLYYLNQAVYSSYRQGRLDRLIQEVVASGGTISTQNVVNWQGNNQMLDAELIVPHILGAFDNAAATDAWPAVAALAGDPQLAEVEGLLRSWDYSSPTGISEGYDPGDNPFALPEPSTQEIEYSVAATVYSQWRSLMIQNTIDATLSAIGLGGSLPPNTLAFNALENLLDNFDAAQGIGASGLNFFTNADAPDQFAARDFLILATLRQSLDLLASDEFAPAFANSTDVMDYRWGKLHRIVLDHPLNDVFNIPNGLYGFTTVEGLPGISRAGGYQVLDASTHNVRADSLNGFMFGSGPSRRFIGNMLPTGPVALQAIGGGQSGVLGDPLYANQLVPWLGNAYLPLQITPAEAAATAVSVLRLEPATP
ncbi:MAG: penicillin acylase family protein [Pseudomonadota bacterium]